ncbi:MAG: hypothetical protein EZS28_038064 [Streblomastix strix]|uniref:Uncharacterized protein n=1 Tax=Streblomastix strix TaxID=222440 RepID=A0A5J4U952_9EUKA|nr:MAG: hypothetical protein EZS28_038064 [Streblomastix strix]
MTIAGIERPIPKIVIFNASVAPAQLDTITVKQGRVHGLQLTSIAYTPPIRNWFEISGSSFALTFPNKLCKPNVKKINPSKILIPV